MQILIAEDDSISRRTLSAMLRKQGHEVVETQDGLQAWNKMQIQDAPRLLVLDIMMPKMDGLELCRKIRASDTWNPPYIILLTAKTKRDDLVVGLEAGANDYVPKPYDFEELRARINVGKRMLEMQSSLFAEISERRKAQQEQQAAYDKLDTLVELNADGIMVIDRQGVILFLNPAGAEMFCKNESELLGEKFGYPLAPGKTTEIELLSENGGTRVAELRTGETEWDGRPALLVTLRDITHRKQAEEALQEKSRELGERVKELNCLYGLSRLMEQSGISRQEMMQSAVELVPFGWQDPDMTCARLLLEGEVFYSRDFRQTAWKQSADIVVNDANAGRIEVFYLRKAPECAEGPFLREERELIENIAARLGQYLEREQDKEALRRSESYYRALFESSGTAMFIINEDTTIALANSNFEELSGYARQELEGKRSWTEFMHSEDGAWMKKYHYLRRRDPEAAPRQYESRFLDRYGQERHLLLSVDMIPETSQSIASGVDLTERKRVEERVYSLSYFDELTGLPNRRLFLELLGQAVSRSQRFEECGAVLLVNIERLRSVNDTLGEQAGNELIREVGRRVWNTLRDRDTVTRVSGDEFMILAEGIDSGENARKLGLRVLERIGAELELSHRQIYPGARIGFTLFPHGSTDPDSLIKQADMALSGAKKSANRIQQFTGDEEKLAREFHLEQDLKSALANEEFWLCYQPQIDLLSGNVVGLEALIRWSHPQRGLVSPGEFIPLLERSGMIASVDAWVVRRVCEQLRLWRDEGLLVRTSVNLSAQELESDTIISVVSSALEENHLPANALGVELTETELMENVDQASGILRTFSGWGISVALDDFGKGYSCLRYLEQLDIHVIKIDKEFVAGIPENADSLILVQTIIAMGHNMGKKVLAEGVEREDQWQKLLELGCDYGQGFLWSRPQPVENCTFIT